MHSEAVGSHGRVSPACCPLMLWRLAQGKEDAVLPIHRPQGRSPFSPSLILCCPTFHSNRDSHLRQVYFCLCFHDRVSCIPGWPQAHCAAQDALNS